MSKLSSCPECQSFLPARASSCPHCGAAVTDASPKRRLAKGALAIVGGGVLAMTLSACYGGADDYMPPDSSPPVDAAMDASGDT